MTPTDLVRRWADCSPSRRPPWRRSLASEPRQQLPESHPSLCARWHSVLHWRCAGRPAAPALFKREGLLPAHGALPGRHARHPLPVVQAGPCMPPERRTARPSAICHLPRRSPLLAAIRVTGDVRLLRCLHMSVKPPDPRRVAGVVPSASRPCPDVICTGESRRRQRSDVRPVRA